jgi:hypothetical protein
MSTFYLGALLVGGGAGFSRIFCGIIPQVIANGLFVHVRPQQLLAACPASARWCKIAVHRRRLRRVSSGHAQRRFLRHFLAHLAPSPFGPSCDSPPTVLLPASGLGQPLAICVIHR